ncbi:ABC transporter ATP-binding protein [Clostridia bacterium]|nr:ABC transporter ATP-binding protein [Clostridia bacterium]
MLLKSLKLKDFRQFKGEQTITFSSDSDKNVTVIMGDNGSGKTTLAQAFTWCLYGETDFKDKILLCKATSRNMLPGQTEKVRAELTLVHKNTVYTIVSEQVYRKTDKSDTPVATVGQRTATIMFLKDGQTEYVKDSQRDGRMKEILPSELARYFFFDGERITAMGDELSEGNGNEFARAVRSLLGLDAFTAAVEHLKKTVKDYDKQYDSHSDSKIDAYTQQILDIEKQIEAVEPKLADINREESPVTEKIGELQLAIEKDKSSTELAARKKKLLAHRDALVSQKSRNISELLSELKRAPAYFAQKLMLDCLQRLKGAKLTDKSVPKITDETIKYLLQRGYCICGEEIHAGNDADNELHKLLEYIPPKSIGDEIAGFRDKCKERTRSGEAMFADFESKYSDVRAFDADYEDVVQEISDIEKQLLGMADVGKLQNDLMRYNAQLRNLQQTKSDAERKIGNLDGERKRIDNLRTELSLKDKTNRSVTTYKAYAQYMYDSLSLQYSAEEQKIRKELETTVNEIFHRILGEGFSLSLNDKYDVSIELNGIGGSSETSTAQNISIIFAFIAGVIQMARESQKDEGGLLVSESYPLVMDAPLSAFDKTRIQTVCDVLPKIAEQVIIFIKDADGEIAEEHLGNRIGKRLTFHMANGSKIETYVS